MFRVSCIQLRSNNSISQNLKKTEKLIHKAIKQKTDFILTPEVSSLFSLNKKQLLKVCKSMNEDNYIKGIKIENSSRCFFVKPISSLVKNLNKIDQNNPYEISKFENLDLIVMVMNTNKIF